MMHGADRFTLEEKIMQCWNVTDDIQTVAEYIADTDMSPSDQDQVLNMLFGMVSLYNRRFSDTMNTFNKFINTHNI